MRAEDPKRRVLKDVFGFDDFRPGQADVMEALLAGRHVLTVMPTGAGKSLCYQVPALVLGGLTIVVSPLVALMQDQVAALRLAGVAADTINSSIDRDDNVAAWRRVTAGETRLLYLAPERLMTERMLEALARLDVRLIAVDEAHCISQWGPAFRPEYEAAVAAARHFPQGADHRADRDGGRGDAPRHRRAAVRRARSKPWCWASTGPTSSSASRRAATASAQLLDFVAAPCRARAASSIACRARRPRRRRRSWSATASRALAYHAGMTKEARDANQNRFMTEAGVVMVATIAFGMGIDKPDVAYVFHTDLPGSLEAYYQEIGRAGRDGRAAEAHMLFGAGDIRMRRHVHRRRGRSRRAQAARPWPAGHPDRLLRDGAVPPPDPARLFRRGSASLAAIATIASTRRRAPTAPRRRSIILAAVAQSGERFGAAHVIDILRGHETEKILERGHQQAGQLRQRRGAQEG